MIIQQKAKIARLGNFRRHVEISTKLYEFFPIGAEVVIIPKSEYEKLKVVPVYCSISGCDRTTSEGLKYKNSPVCRTCYEQLSGQNGIKQ